MVWLISLFGAGLIYLWDQSRRPRRRTLNIKKEECSRAYRILVISDFHGNSWMNARAFVESLPLYDAIVHLGDMVSRDQKSLHPTREFLTLLSQKSENCFFVLGNHEMDRGRQWATTFYEGLGWCPLHHQIVDLGEGRDQLTMTGMDMASSYPEDEIPYSTDLGFYHSLNTYLSRWKNVTSHRTIFSGHTHGGQVRVPGVGQVLGHGWELFPKVSKGTYCRDGVRAYITAGLGNTSLPIRICNPIEFLEVFVEEKEDA